ncbi:MAG: lipoprotein-releasing ABC transporter permease subunit [Betaproteobacteria bacterium]
MKSFEYFIGLRYTRSPQRTRFISVISLISVIGIALGMTVLITVLSVMNGFQREVRTRMLSAVAHIQVSGSAEQLTDWGKVDALITHQPHVLATAPYINGQGLLNSGSQVRGIYLRGIFPDQESTVDQLGSSMLLGQLNLLKPGEFKIILGDALAGTLNVNVGEKVILLVPQGQVTPAGILPRLRQFTVVGIFHVGHYEIDSGLALAHLDDVQKVYRMGDKISGLRLKLDDPLIAPEVARNLIKRLPPDTLVSDWTRLNATYFRAVDIEKRMMSLLLFFIIAIAAFNLVSSLFMVVKEKQADIAILRTLGAAPRSIMKIFMFQGILIGFTGVVMGIIFGVLGATYVDVIVGFVERLFGFKFLDPSIYQISSLPSELHWMDVVLTAIFSFFMSAIATIYPAWRASRVHPAEALRYE